MRANVGTANDDASAILVDVPPLPLSLYASPFKTLKLLAFALGFVALGLYGYHHPPHRHDPLIGQWGSVIVVLVFSLISARFLWIALFGLCVVRADWAGLMIWRWPPIAWLDITDIRVLTYEVRGRQFEVIGIFVTETQRFIDARSWLARLNLALWPGRFATPIFFNCGLLNVEPAVLCQWLNEYRWRHS